MVATSWTAFAGPIAADLKRRAALVVAICFANDDDLGATDLCASGSGRTTTGPRGRLENMRKSNGLLALTRHADLATSPSSTLAVKYNDAGSQDVQVIENYLDAS